MKKSLEKVFNKAVDKVNNLYDDIIKNKKNNMSKFVEDLDKPQPQKAVKTVGPKKGVVEVTVIEKEPELQSKLITEKPKRWLLK